MNSFSHSSFQNRVRLFFLVEKYHKSISNLQRQQFVPIQSNSSITTKGCHIKGKGKIGQLFFIGSIAQTVSCIQGRTHDYTSGATQSRGSDKQVAQGQYVVSDTRCPALSDCELE